jgi:hypothetical protein
LKYESHKLLIVLKVPIEIDLDVLGLPPTQSHQIEGQELFSHTKDSELMATISEVGQTGLSRDVQISSSQLVSLLEQNGQFLYAQPQTQHEQDNPGNDKRGTAAECEGLDILPVKENCLAIQLQTPSLENKRMGNLLDLLDLVNDGLALSVNAIAAIFCLGKLANYSQEGMLKSSP